MSGPGNLFGEIRTIHGTVIRVSMSSYADEPCIWLALEEGISTTGAALVNKEQAKELRSVLDEFIWTAE